jgi:hypothetical protein
MFLMGTLGIFSDIDAINGYVCYESFHFGQDFIGNFPKSLLLTSSSFSSLCLECCLGYTVTREPQRSLRRTQTLCHAILAATLELHSVLPGLILSLMKEKASVCLVP